MQALLSLFILILVSPTFAANIYVAPVQGTNMSESETKTVRELIKAEVQNQNKHRLVDTLDNAEFFVQTKIIKFNSYTLSMTRWKGNEKVSSGQWKVKNLSELEAQLSGAVQEVLNSSKNKKQAVLFENKKSLGEQAAEKKQRANFERVQARRQAMIGFGPAYFSNMNASGSGIGFQAGYIWNIDDHFDLGLQSDFAISTEYSKTHMFSGKIITNYFFASNDISPFVGAGFGYGWANIDSPANNTLADESASGFAMSLHAGVKFFRTSTVNFVVAGEYTNIFDKSSLGQPGAFLIKVALLY